MFDREHFGNPPETPDNLVEVPFSYLDPAARWLLESQSSQAGEGGVVGVSRGGELALLLGTRFDWVSVALSWVGRGLVWQRRLRSDPVWRDDSRAVPHPTWKADLPETETGNEQLKTVVDR